jgi:hypothetical protein
MLPIIKSNIEKPPFPTEYSPPSSAGLKDPQPTKPTVRH